MVVTAVVLAAVTAVVMSIGVVTNARLLTIKNKRLTVNLIGVQYVVLKTTKCLQVSIQSDAGAM